LPLRRGQFGDATVPRTVRCVSISRCARAPIWGPWDAPRRTGAKPTRPLCSSGTRSGRIPGEACQESVGARRPESPRRRSRERVETRGAARKRDQAMESLPGTIVRAACRERSFYWTSRLQPFNERTRISACAQHTALRDLSSFDRFCSVVDDPLSAQREHRAPFTADWRAIEHFTLVPSVKFFLA